MADYQLFIAPFHFGHNHSIQLSMQVNLIGFTQSYHYLLLPATRVVCNCGQTRYLKEKWICKLDDVHLGAHNQLVYN